MKILLIVYDNDSYIHYFPTGLGYIASILLKKGIHVEVYSQDKNHYPEKHLTEYLDNNKFDVVCMSTVGGYYQYRKLIKISEAINKSKNRPFYILGGHGSAPEPEYFIKKTNADVVVIGEGEQTIAELADAIAQHRPLNNIKGIAFKDGDKVIVNERQELIQDIDSIPLPAYHLFPIDYYKMMREPHASKTDFVMTMMSGRGCLFHCNFCYRMDAGFRPRKSESIIEEMLYLQREYGITYIEFIDELLMSSIDRTIELCESFLRANLNIKWYCEGRLNFADAGVLKIMKKAGCVFINYGIEAMDDQVLMNMNKALTTDMIIKGVEATLSAGISPGLNIIFGNIGDTKETLMKGVNFLLKYGDGSQLRTIRPVTPYPGSPLYYYAIKNGLLKDCEDFYEHKHVNSDLLSVNFTELSDDEFHKSLLEANTILIKDYYQKKLKTSLDEARKLYLEKNINFRGFRQI